MNLKALTGNRAVKLLKSTFDNWMEDKALHLSAALAYYSIFSIAPLLVIAISGAGLVLGAEAVRGHLDEQLKSYVGAKAAESVQSMVQSSSKRSSGWIGTVVGFITLMLGASGVFGQLKDALNTIWKVKAKSGTGISGILRERLLSFGMVLVIGFLLLTSLLLTTALAALSGRFERLVGMPAFVGATLGFVISFGVVTLLFALIFKVLPDVEIEWRNVWIGAAVTALLFELGKFGLSFYLGRESTASSFGAAGSVVLLLLWVYYASCIMLFGAEFTQVYARESGHEIKPARGAERVTPEDRAEQGLAAASAARPAIAPVRTEVIAISVPTDGRSPVGSLLAVVAGSIVVGLFARRWAEREQTPLVRIRGGLTELGEQATENLGELVKRGRKEISRRLS